MAISYLSRPVAPTVQPYQEPVELIIQAAQQKQNKYDTVLDSIFAKENSLMNLDTQYGSDEITSRKNVMLKQMDESLTSMSKMDFLNPENVKRAESLFEPITSDEGIVNAVGVTRKTKEQAEFFKEWKDKKPESYSALNESYFWNDVAKNKKMSEKDFMQHPRNPISVQYTDIDKIFKDAASTLKANHITVESSPSGGYIIKHENEILSINDIMKYLPNGANVLAQAKINAWADYASVSQGELLTNQHQQMLHPVEQANKDISAQKAELDNITAKLALVKAGASPDAIAYIQANYGGDKARAIKDLTDRQGSYSTAIKNNMGLIQEAAGDLEKWEKSYGLQKDAQGNPVKDATGNYVFTKPLDEDQLEGLKTQVWLQNKKFATANAFQVDTDKISIEKDQVYGDMLASQRQFALEKFKAENDLNKVRLESILNPKKGTKTSGTGGDGSGDGTEADALPATQPLPADTKLPDEKLDSEKLNQTVTELQKAIGTNSFGTDGTSFGNIIMKKMSYGASREQASKDFEASLKSYSSIKAQYDKAKDLGQDINYSSQIPGSTQTYGDYFSKHKDEAQYLLELGLNKAQADNLVKLKGVVTKDAEDEAIAQSKVNFGDSRLVSVNFHHFPISFGAIGHNIWAAAKKAWQDAKDGIWSSAEDMKKADLYEKVTHPVNALLNVPADIVKDVADKNWNAAVVNKLYDANASHLNGMSKDDFREQFVNQNSMTFVKPETSVTKMIFDAASGAPPLQEDESINTYKKMRGDLIEKGLKQFSLTALGVPQTFTDYSNEKAPAKALHENMMNYVMPQLKDSDGVQLTIDKSDVQIDSWVFKPTGVDINISYTQKGLGVKKTTHTTIPMSDAFMDNNGIVRPYISSIQTGLDMQWQSNHSDKNYKANPNAVALYDLDLNSAKYTFAKNPDGSYGLAKWSDNKTKPVEADFKPIASVEQGYQLIVNGELPQTSEDQKDQAMLDAFKFLQQNSAQYLNYK